MVVSRQAAQNAYLPKKDGSTEVQIINGKIQTTNKIKLTFTTAIRVSDYVDSEV